jgi:hypothetical protein
MRRVFPLLLLLACGDTTDDTAVDGPCGSLVATPAVLVPTAVTFSWTTGAPGIATVELSREGADDVSSWVSETEGTDHAVIAHGLATNGDYTWTATVQTAEGEVRCPAQALKVTAPPREALKFKVTVSEPGSAVADGFVVLSTIQDDSAWTGVVDGEGIYRFVYPTDEDWHTVGRARISNDGKSVLFNYFDRERVLDAAGVARVSLDGTIDERTRTLLGHHDFVELPGARLAWNGYDRRDWPMEPITGVHAYHYDANCPGGLCPIAAESFYIGDEGIGESDTPAEMFNWYDDWDVEPFWRCDHMTNFGSFVPGYFEWQHGNSIGYVESQNAIYVVSRYLDTLYKHDADTGALLWEAGDTASSDFTLAGGEWWEHGHMSDIWEDGFLIFDNGDHRGFTRVSEYAWDETAMTFDQVWSVDHPTGNMLEILGDARRLPNGNVLISWSADAIVQEMTPEGDVVWEMTASDGTFGIIGRVTFVESL